MEDKTKPDIFIIGLGVLIPDHISIQAQRAISQCSQLYSIVQEPSRVWAPQGRSGDINIINALDLYVEGRLRMENYELVARTIVNAFTPGQSVGYVTYGNPMSYDRVAQELLKHAN